jgi:transposase
VTDDRRDRRVAELEALVEKQAAVIKQQTAQIKHLEKRVAELERQLGQNSSNSGKPPSSDSPSQRQNRQNKSKPKRSRRKRGGQPGHKAKTRALVPPEQVDQFVDCRPKECRRCGKELARIDDPSPLQHQVFELPKLTPDVTEYRLHRVDCDCGITTCGTLPAGASNSFLGPRFAAFLTVLTGAYHLSRRQAVALVHDLTGVKLSLGAVSHSERRVSEALASPVAEAHEQAREAPIKHIDETGWVQAAARRSLWTIATTFLTVFVIATDATRVTVQQLVGAAKGILISDRATAFQFWSVENRQVCWAHLIRKFVSFAEHDDDRVRALGEHLLFLGHSLLHYWHQVRDGTMTRSELCNITDGLRQAFAARLERGVGLQVRGVSGACKNLLEHEPALWTFVYELGVEPTNNHAERELRGFVMWRRKSFGTQSERGSRFAERIMTVVHSLRKQRRDVLAFVTDACQAALDNKPAPSLLPDHR